MPAVDLGNEALLLLRRSLAVGTGWLLDDTVHWSYWGALQTAWSQPLNAPGGTPAWRVRLSTRLLDGFSKSPAHVTALGSIPLQPSLGGVALRRKTLEIVSAVDLDSSNLGSMVQVLSIAARTHVADARHLVSGSKKLAAAGLTSVIDEAATIPETFLNPVLLRDTQDDGHSWTKREIASCINAIRPKREAPATETPWGVTATFALDWTNAVRSVLEVRPDTSRPLFGKGIAVTLWTPVRGGPLEALVWNEREAAPRGTGDVLGGWWAPEGGFLVHRSFYPAALCQPDLVVQFLQTDVRRAYAANKCVAALE